MVIAYLVVGAASTTALLKQQLEGGWWEGTKNLVHGTNIGYHSPEKYYPVPSTTQY